MMLKWSDYAWLSSGLRVQYRVVDALVRRELMAIGGRKGFGFLIVFIEPAAILLFLSIWAWSRSDKQNFQESRQLFTFVFSGLLFLWLCRHPFNKIGGVVRFGRELLAHRLVKPIDLIIARAIVGMTSMLSIMLVLAPIVMVLGLVHTPNDYPLMLYSLFLAMWYVLALCIIIGVISSMFAIGVYLGIIVGVAHLVVAGSFFMVDWFTRDFREILLLFPMINTMEMLRDGWYGHIVQCHYSVWYTIFANVLLTFFGLFLDRIYAMMRTLYGTSE